MPPNYIFVITRAAVELRCDEVTGEKNELTIEVEKMSNKHMLALVHTHVIPMNLEHNGYCQPYGELIEKTDILSKGRNETKIAKFCNNFGLKSDETKYHPSRKNLHMFRNLKLPTGIMHIRVFHEKSNGCMAALTTIDQPIQVEDFYYMAEDLADKYKLDKGVWTAVVPMKKQYESVLDVELITEDL